MIRFQGSIRLLVFAAALIAALPAHSETIKHTVELSPASVSLSDAGGKTMVSVDDYRTMTDAGLPSLPYQVVTILLPPGEKVDGFDVEVSAALDLSITSPVAVAPAMVSEHGHIGSGGALAGAAKRGVFPGESVRYMGMGYWHGRAIASFAVFPLRTNDGVLTLNETVGITVRTAPDERADEVVRRERHRPLLEAQFARSLERRVVNPEMNARYLGFAQPTSGKQPRGFAPTSYPSLEGSPVDYLIITSDALAAEYQRLADWKTAKGVPTVIRTTEWIAANGKQGVDLQETLRFFIQDAYAKWGIKFLLLGGDTDVMPPRYGYSRWHKGGTKATADLYFSCLDGSWNDTHDQLWGEGVNGVPFDNPDLFAEVYQGRIPFSDVSGVSTMIDKILSYEQAVVTDHLDKHLMLAEVLFPTDWPLDPVITLNGGDLAETVIALTMAGLTVQIDRLYETDYLYPGSLPESKAAAIAALNTGYNFVNHIGHGFRFNMSVGDASILNGDADALTNAGRWFNLFMLNCTAAAYDFFLPQRALPAQRRWRCRHRDWRERQRLPQRVAALHDRVLQPGFRTGRCPHRRGVRAVA